MQGHRATQPRALCTCGFAVETPSCLIKASVELVVPYSSPSTPSPSQGRCDVELHPFLAPAESAVVGDGLGAWLHRWGWDTEWAVGMHLSSWGRSRG